MLVQFSCTLKITQPTSVTNELTVLLWSPTTAQAHRLLLFVDVELVPGGGGYSTDAWVGRCGPGVQTLTLFKTEFSDFHIPFETGFKIFRPYLRHLTEVIPRLGLE